MSRLDALLRDCDESAGKLDATLADLVSGQNYRLDYLGADIRPLQPEPITAPVAIGAVNLLDEMARRAVEGEQIETVRDAHWNRAPHDLSAAGALAMMAVQ